MKLWGGRFTKETNELVNNFNASISFDQKFYKQDIQGSIAHATMLAAQGIISEDEGKQITDGLKGILSDIESGKLEITDEYEDIHTFMEATLIERIGDAGKKLHTGRRNALTGRRDQSQKIRIGAPAQPVPRQRSAPLAGCVLCAERHIKRNPH